MAAVFEIQKLLGQSGKSIALQTRLGNDIENEQGSFDPGETSEGRFRLYLKTHGGNVKPRKPPSAIYNCFGHVWASRRTWIMEASAIELILKDDSYRRLDSDEEPVPGDVVLYRDQRQILVHVGEVIEYSGLQVPTQAVVQTPKYARVLSKMGVLGEVTHRADYRDVLGRDFRDVTVEYWTERPT